MEIETTPVVIGALGVLKKQPASKLSGARWQKEGELAIAFLEFEYLHRKSRCEMLIGGDDISNDVITLGTCFSMFVYIRACFRFVLIVGKLTAQSTGNYRGIGRKLQASLPFPAPPPQFPESLLAGLLGRGWKSTLTEFQDQHVMDLYKILEIRQKNHITQKF